MFALAKIYYCAIC